MSGSRSFQWVHEHDSLLLVSKQIVTIRMFWSQFQPRLTLTARDLHHNKQRVSPFHHDLLYFQYFYSCCHERNVFDVILLGEKERVSSLYHDLGSIGLIGNFWIDTQPVPLNVKQLLNPIFSSNRVSGRSLENDEKTHVYFLVDDFFDFHPFNFRDHVTHNECVRSYFIELKSSLLSTFHINKIYSFLMFLPYFMHVLCMTSFVQKDRLKIPIMFVYGIDNVKNYCFSVAQNFVKIFLPPGVNPKLGMGCKLIVHPTWKMYWKKSLGITTLSCTVGSRRLRLEWFGKLRDTRLLLMNQDNAEIFFSSSSCHDFLPLVVNPMIPKHKMILEILFESWEFNYSIIFSM